MKIDGAVANEGFRHRRFPTLAHVGCRLGDSSARIQDIADGVATRSHRRFQGKTGMTTLEQRLATPLHETLDHRERAHIKHALAGAPHKRGVPGV